MRVSPGSVSTSLSSPLPLRMPSMEWPGLTSVSVSSPWPFSSLEMELMLGTVSSEQTPSSTNLSRISQLKMPGFLSWYSFTFFSILSVSIFGLLPPTTPGLMLPVSWYLLSILETQP